METQFRNLAARVSSLLAALVLALAQGGAQAQPAYRYSQPELDQMLAPVALYPDALLSQILMAATYPMEVIEAARWAREHPELPGDATVRAAESEDWDPSVKSLLAFPQVLARMRENLQWTQALGDAFLDQETQMMDTVQALRRKAQAAGNLRSDERVSVVENGPDLQLQPLDPQVVYIPYYDPAVAYGPWWWPAYPPIYLRPWPGYYARPAYAGVFYWAPPVRISPWLFFGAIDWRRRVVRAVQVNNVYFNATARPAHAYPPASVYRPGAWQHDPDRGREPAYRATPAPQRFGAVSAAPVASHAARPADAHLPAWRTETHPDARFGERRAEARVGLPPAPVIALGSPAYTYRSEPGPRLDVPRPTQPHMEARPAAGPVHQEPTHIAVARQSLPYASAPRGDVHPPPAAMPRDAGARFSGRPPIGR